MRQVAWLPHNSSPTIWDIVQRLCALSGVQPSHAESVQIVHYTAGQRYNGHFDAYDKTTTKGQRLTKDSGNRMLTMLVYLSTATEGGHTGPCRQ